MHRAGAPEQRPVAGRAVAAQPSASRSAITATAATSRRASRRARRRRALRRAASSRPEQLRHHGLGAARARARGTTPPARRRRRTSITGTPYAVARRRASAGLRPGASTNACGRARWARKPSSCTSIAPLPATIPGTWRRTASSCAAESRPRVPGVDPALAPGRRRGMPRPARRSRPPARRRRSARCRRAAARTGVLRRGRRRRSRSAARRPGWAPAAPRRSWRRA